MQGKKPRLSQAKGRTTPDVLAPSGFPPPLRKPPSRSESAWTKLGVAVRDYDPFLKHDSYRKARKKRR